MNIFSAVAACVADGGTVASFAGWDEDKYLRQYGIDGDEGPIVLLHDADGRVSGYCPTMREWAGENDWSTRSIV